MEVFLVGTMWFWLATATVLIALGVSVFNDSGVFTTIFALVFLAFLQFLAKVNILGFAVHHPLLMVLFIAGYVGIGAFWMLLKWKLLLKAVSRKYSDLRTEWYNEAKSDRRYSGMSQDRLFEMFTNSSSMSEIRKKFGIRGIPLKVRNEYPTLFYWAIYWPFSAVVTLLNDPIHYVFRSMIRGLSGIMQTMSDKEFNKYEELYK